MIRIFGLGNNFPYVVMLGAAYDIITNGDTKVSVNSENEAHPGTSAILLADILPSMFLKFVTPFFIHRWHYHFKIGLACTLSISSFVIVHSAKTLWVGIFGVVVASLSAGVGDVSFLSMSAFFGPEVISAWSSGTGAAGLFGALSYAVLAKLVGPADTLLILIIVPVITSIIYFFVLDRPDHASFRFSWTSFSARLRSRLCCGTISYAELRRTDSAMNRILFLIVDLTDVAQMCDDDEVLNQAPQGGNTVNVPSHSTRLQQLHPPPRMKILLFRQMSSLFISLILVYFFEYLINQSLCINFVICLTEVIYGYINSIWIMSALILYEGCLGGFAYVNTFHRISQETDPHYREYAMSSAAVADSVGITAAGVLGLYLTPRLRPPLKAGQI